MTAIRVLARIGSAAAVRTGPDDDRPSQVHRGLSLLALLSLFQGTAGALRAQALGNHRLLVMLILLYGAMMLLAVLVFTVQKQRALIRVDLLILLVALLRLAELFMVSTGSHIKPYGDDEGPLITLAATAFAHGSHVYGVHWPDFAQHYRVGTTPLMNGEIADSFGYPPLSALLTAPFVLWLPSWVPIAGVMSTGALVVTALLMFRMLPAQLRPAATLMCFGFDWFFTYARDGYPIFLTLPFLAVVLYRWTRTGSGGVLGRSGVVSAVCLGFALCAHQLAWFIAPFVIAGMLLARRGELPWRGALKVTGRYTGLALATFLLLNLPFAVRDGSAWAHGLFSVITQHASPQGLGPVDVSAFLTSGTGDLGMYSTAALALLAGTFVGFLLFPRRLAPALAVLPWPAFYLSTRSTETYMVLLVPLWLIAFATCDRVDVARIWQWRPALLQGRRARLAMPALLALPALGCLLTAVSTPVPVAVNRISLSPGPVSGGQPTIERISFTLTNASGQSITPNFVTDSSYWIDNDWRVTSGPRTLGPDRTAAYVLTRTGSALATNPNGRVLLQVLSDNPQTLTNALLPVRSLAR